AQPMAFGCHDDQGKLLEDFCARLVDMCVRLFTSIQFFFVKFTTNKLKSSLVAPLLSELKEVMAGHLMTMSDARYQELLQRGLSRLSENVGEMQKRVSVA